MATRSGGHGHHGGFNPYRDAHGRFTTKGNAGKPTVAQAQRQATAASAAARTAQQNLRAGGPLGRPGPNNTQILTDADYARLHMVARAEAARARAQADLRNARRRAKGK
jgi:hypothetical protein